MKVGRNDPCPCGSGKKYKKCCLGKDLTARDKQIKREDERLAEAAYATPPPAAARPKLPPLPPLPPAPERPVDPHVAAINARWQEFEAQEYEGKVALFHRTLDDPELLDEEMAFEMLANLHDEVAAHGQRERFRELLNALRDRLPDVYASRVHYYLSWLIEDALAAGRREELPAWTQEMAAYAGAQIDEFNRVVDQLAYHGLLELLVPMLRRAWPDVKVSGEIVPWGVSEFAERAIGCEVFDYLEHSAAPAGDDPALLERVHYYMDEPRLEILRERVADLAGQNPRSWALSDFQLQPLPRRRRDDWDDDASEEEPPPRDPGRSNLFRLSEEFLSWLHREHGVPWTRGEMGRANLLEYLLERFDGKLEPRPGLLDDLARPRRHRPPPKPQPLRHVLVPDRATFDRYLGGLLRMLNWRHYEASAALELVPAWLRFLEARQLLDGATRLQTLKALEPLRAEAGKVWDSDKWDPLLRQGLGFWDEGNSEGRSRQATPS